jgi:hypothetical protein
MRTSRVSPNDAFNPTATGNAAAPAERPVNLVPLSGNAPTAALQYCMPELSRFLGIAAG